MKTFLTKKNLAIMLAVLLVVVGLIVRGMIKDRKQGKSSCGGDCASCHGGCSHKC